MKKNSSAFEFKLNYDFFSTTCQAGPQLRHVILILSGFILFGYSWITSYYLDQKLIDQDRQG